jgi:hypothetical protein
MTPYHSAGVIQTSLQWLNKSFSRSIKVSMSMLISMQANSISIDIDMSSHRHIPLYPCPPLAVSPHQDELPSDEYSDFPPIREHQSTPDPLHSPLSMTTNFFHPRSSAVIRKGPVRHPEQCSSPTQLELPDSPPSQSPRYSRRRNKGLGCKDILNTTEILMRYPKVRN